MDLSVQAFDKICRVCLLESGDMLSIFTKMDGEERSLLQMLAFTADINVKLEDSLPKQVCSDCHSVMCKADAFKRRCQESESILLNLSHTIKSKGETDLLKNDSKIHDNSDIKQKTNSYDSYKASNSNIYGSKDSFDTKNDLLNSVLPMPDTNNSITTISEVPITYEESVKEEAISYFDDEIDFSDHYLDTTPSEVPLELKQERSDKIKEEKKHSCLCGQSFTSKDKYKIHITQENCNKHNNMVEKLKNNNFIGTKNKIQCWDCDRKFRTHHTLKLHQQAYHKKSIHSISEQCVTSKTDISIPNCKKIDEPKTVQCSMCLRKFKNKTSLLTHLEKHKEKDYIKHVCEICKREFKYKAYLENHILTLHSRKNGISCDVCALSFPNEKSLESHKESHKNEKKHQCTICKKSFLMLCTLKEHMRTHTGEKPFLCSQCGRGFSQKTNLAQHMRRHQGLKPFKCESCDKGFVSKGELDAHTRKHSGAHPFVCDDCGNGFTTSSALVKHRRTHTGEKPYQCDLCPMRFAASGTLKNHRRIHTGERPFQCSYCEKAFVQRNDLISHIRCHTGEKPYICTQCGQSFRKAAGLKTHVKMHVKEPVHILQGVTAMLNGMQCSEQ